MLAKRDIKGLCKVIAKSGVVAPEEVVQASDALVGIGEDAVEPLIGILQDINRHNWYCARFRTSSYLVAQTLGRIGDAKAVEPLIETLLKNDEFPDVQQSTAEALGRIGDRRAVDPLIGALDEPLTRWHAANALGKIGEIAFEPLSKVLENMEESQREDIISTFVAAFAEKKGIMRAQAEQTFKELMEKIE